MKFLLPFGTLNILSWKKKENLEKNNEFIISRNTAKISELSNLEKKNVCIK